VARNRKRAKERRSRRPNARPVTRPGVATARPGREDPSLDRNGIGEGAASLEETPSPIEHATPDAELADAQLALGRPELSRGASGEVPDGEEFDEEELAAQATGADGAGAGGSGVVGRAGSGGGQGGDLAPTGSSAAVPRGGLANRLITFLQGSWRELQRVQWPDRRQVMQATGVVIGFVIVAGLYLGLADTVATKLVNLILQ
jgi:preprotein translocase subunit SecE